LIATRPATISKSACRGENRITSAPNRAKSYRLDAVAISSIPQHAVANGNGHTLFRRHQFAAFFKFNVKKLSGNAVGSKAIVNHQLPLNSINPA
jgi:hypothetical protein